MEMRQLKTSACVVDQEFMIELPEALNIADQINRTIAGKRIISVMVAQTPHKLAWYYGDRSRYSDILDGQAFEKAVAHGGLVEIKAGRTDILFGEGVNIRFHDVDAPLPLKHQFLIEFDDRTALSAVVQMYGGMGAFLEGELDNPYYKVAKERPSPFSPDFDEKYFRSILSVTEAKKSSLKAILATGQRIPGLGNGVLQDILFNAGMHPKRKVGTLGAKDVENLFKAVKSTLIVMAEKGGRDTEMDLFGRPGGYRTLLNKNSADKPCPICGTLIRKEAYMGGSVYFCEKCQEQ
jgi:formamidopyrimidine-DNA glycosylase